MQAHPIFFIALAAALAGAFAFGLRALVARLRDDPPTETQDDFAAALRRGQVQLERMND
ncbi:hypothetical protein SAMN05216376_111152 [Mameliella alba]|uniref:hypothetical protein n=1 Tax=Mameliella alba TaxID=561184 RepID=UPI00088613B6|nr:hypothetical protein [Mameliella alba]PTR37272.1 hypothetical protein LX94_03611 [Mameliella alba]GGF73424.1 hypothetical protein GCM10011319_37430 [Mameliella alba]SDD77345.1 hypothetical protein SAMN05216376_111152 [Mameliella alba]